MRVLQEREFERVGGIRTIPVNIRLIAATNKDLEKAVEDGEFRRDLYYRLNVVSLEMPPLRLRREDIPMLAEYFSRKYSNKASVKAKRISPDAMACLVNYDWPGNVRELENAMERAVVLCASEVIGLEDLPESILERETPAGSGQSQIPWCNKGLEKTANPKRPARRQGELHRSSPSAGGSPQLPSPLNTQSGAKRFSAVVELATLVET